MSILITLLLLIEVVTAFLLIVVILAQKSKDQGLGMAFGSGMGESLFGSRTGNVLTRMTVTLIIVFTICTVVLGVLFSGGRGASRSGSVMDGAGSRQVPVAPVAAPAASQPLLPSGQPPMIMTEDAPAAAQTLQVDAEGNLQPVAGVTEVVAEVEATVAEAESPAEVKVEAVAVEAPAEAPVVSEEPAEAPVEAPAAPAEVEAAAPQD